MRYLLCSTLLCFILGAGATSLPAHDGHHGHGPLATHAHHGPGLEPAGESPAPERPGKRLELAQEGAENRVTGKGAFTFRHRPLELPAAMQQHLRKAHGGFAPDPEAHGGDGSTYFSLKGVGLMRIRPDLSGIDVVGGDAAFVGVNLHNTCLFRAHDVTYLALPSDEAQRVFITNPAGQLIRVLSNPYGQKPAFRVCDVEYVAGTLFAVNGYADNVCFTANPMQGSSEDPRVGVWKPLRFGGRGKTHGKFGTAHGVTVVPASNVMTIADRANSRLESYTREGRYIGGIGLPAGCLPCDVDYHGRYAVVGCLKGPGGSTPAPIYILEDGNLVAELNIGRDLGLPGFTHIHNACFRVIERPDGRTQFFVLAYAWNPGNFAILEQVLDS